MTDNTLLHIQNKPKMNVETYIQQFNVLGKDDYINCDNISQMLYSAFLNKFMIKMSHEEYIYFKEYQERVFDLVENLRDLSAATIPLVFDYLNDVNQYLVDVIIMVWCLPRTDSYFSKKKYNETYKENIEKYNKKMIKNINHIVMKKFCIETLSKTNNVPVHCIDYLWFYMNTLSLDFTFYNYESGGYIGFQMPEHNRHNIQNQEHDSTKLETYIEFGFNMEYLLEIGLGQVIFKDDQKGSFRNFLKNFITNISLVQQLLTTPSKNNYRKQVLNISKNPSKYFGDALTTIPSEVMILLEK